MKAVLPNLTKSFYQRVTPPSEIYLLGESSRRKLIRSAQLYHRRPPITEETNQFIPFFQHLAFNVPDRWEIQQQYVSCLWAAGRDNDPLATSMLLHFGFCQQFDIPMGGWSQHKFIPVDGGMMVDFEYNHTFQDRFEYACNAIDSAILECGNFPEHDPRSKEDPKKIMSAAMKAFFFYKDRYISISQDYRTAITIQLSNFIDELLNPMTTEYPVVPQIDEPPEEEMVDNQQIIFYYEDFKFATTVSNAQQKQRITNNTNACFNAIYPKLAELPRDTPLPRSEIPISENKQLQAALKYGYLQKPKHGYYLIPSSIDEERS
jgi:hypothetical protein